MAKRVASYKNTLNKFMLARFLSLSGDAFFLIALSWWILSKSTSSSDLPIIMGVFALTTCLFLILSGPLGDKYSKKKLMIIGDIICILSLSGMFILIALDHYDLLFVVLLFTIKSLGQAIFGTSSQSIIPSIVPKENLPEAFSKAVIIVGLSGGLGGVLGGLSVSFMGIQNSILVDIGSYLLSVIIISYLKIANPIIDMKKQKNSHWYHDIKTGYQYLISVRAIFLLIVIVSILSFLIAPLPVLLPIIVKNELHLDAWFLGMVEGGYAIGIVFGGLVIQRILRKLSMKKAISAGILLIAISLFGLSIFRNQYSLLVGYMLFGFLIPLCNVPLSTAIWRHVSDEYLSRIASIVMLSTKMFGPISILVISLLIDALNTFTIILFISIGWFITFLIFNHISEVSQIFSCKKNNG